MNTKNLSSASSKRYDMIVFCHLRWDYVYQRPQHLITRLAADYKILVVEEGVGTQQHPKSFFNVTEISKNIDVCKPTVDHMAEVGKYLQQHLQQKEYSIGWFYSAAFVSVLDHFGFDTVVYDCMDELSLFKGASSEIIQQEKSLLSAADVVYTGGKSLYEAKRLVHHNVHCFPSSVDYNHFSTQNELLQKPADLKNIEGKLVGYYGVIDERIDLELLRKTAELAPEISFVMIGPVCKIDEKDLPRRSNIHYLGMKTYEELPLYLHFFDIAMMPFALNDATRYISPTKTLEYMAAGKPIISTRIRDVERDYSHCISLVDNEHDFAEALKSAAVCKNSYEGILTKTSWNNTAKQMNLKIKEAVA